MTARLREFLNEVRDWFWANPYGGSDHANDLLIAVETVRGLHPELGTLDLLSDLMESGFRHCEFLDSNHDDSDVMAIIDEPSLDARLTALHAVMIREILRGEDRPGGWESSRDGPTAVEDKRRLDLFDHEENRRLRLK